jgi:hypothetical protein
MSEGVKIIEDCTARNGAQISTLTDRASKQRAELDPVQISLKEICDKYNRLILQQPRRSSLWSRLFG